MKQKGRKMKNKYLSRCCYFAQLEKAAIVMGEQEIERERKNPSDEWKKIFQNSECTIRAYKSHDEYLEDLEHTLRDNKRDYAQHLKEIKEYSKNYEEPYLKNTLLTHLLCTEYKPEDYLDIWDRIAIALEDEKYLKEHPEEANEEAQYMSDDIAELEEKLKDMRTGWKPEKKPNLDKELALIKEWVESKNEFMANEI